MRSEYAGRTAKFSHGDTVRYARFDGEDIAKNIFGDKHSDAKGWKAKINVGADGNVFELVENAAYSGYKTETGKVTPAHKNVSGWEYNVKTIQIDGTMFDLVANVRLKQGGEYVYSIQLNENKKAPASSVAVFANGNPALKVEETGARNNVSADSIS